MIITLSAIFISASTQFSLPDGLLSSMCYVESRHTPTAIHHDDGGEDSLGLCQVKLSTAKWLGFEGDYNDLLDPKINVYYAAKYLSYQIQRYNGNITQGLIAYNRGNSRGLYATDYSLKVLTLWLASDQHLSLTQN